MFRSHIAGAAVALALSVFALPASGGAQGLQGWVGAWEAAPQAQTGPLKPIGNQTVRQRLRSSLAGRRLRVVLSNAYGTKPLVIGAASIARSKDGVVEGAPVALRFGGRSSIVVPPGAPAYSDPVDLPVDSMAELSVSLFLPQSTLPETYHRALPAQDAAGPAVAAEALISAEGDFTDKAALAGSSPGARLFVARLDVLPARPAKLVAVLGTTRTEGDGRWPEHLARRLQAARHNVGVVNASLVANPLTRPYPGGGEAALARFDRDVLMVPGLTHVVLADAINDIGQPGGPVVPAAEAPSLQLLTDAYLQLAARARARGVKVIAATVPPFEGVPFQGFYSAEKEALRMALNQWIRASVAFDGVIDLDAILRDPARPSRITASLATANSFGPNDAGEHRIAESLDLRLFR